MKPRRSKKFRRIHSSKNSETIKEKQATACMKRKSEQIGKGMAAWSKGLESAAPDLARKLDRPRQAGWDALEELDLPRYVRVHISVEEFLDDPAKTTAEIPSKRLFVFLQPKEGLPVRKTKLTLEEAVAFVRQTVGEHPENWEADIAETEEEKFGGNIVVKKDGRAIIEMTTQGQGGVSAGTVTPELRAWQDHLTGLWKYDFEDVELRRLVQDIMREVPHEDREYLPGLYEFHVVQPEENDPLEVKFIDFNDIST